jgi:hypothetical protein
MQPQGEVESLLDRIWARFPDSTAHMVAYTADQPAGWHLLQRCANHLPPSATRVTMVVDGDTWYLPDGATGTVDRFGPLATEASFHGLQTLPNRAELAARFASPPNTDELAAQVDTALADLPPATQSSAVIISMRDLIRRNLPGGSEPSNTTGLDTTDAIQMAILAQHGQAREVALFSITRDHADAHLALWRSVVNHVPEDLAEPPLFLAGMAAWAAGDGAAASIALDRAERLGRPGVHRPAMMLDALINRVTPPTAWDALRAEGLQIADRAVGDAVSSIHTPAVWESIPQHPLKLGPQPPDSAPPAPGIAI